MGKSRYPKVAILPSTTRKGTTLSTSAALDSPSVISQLVSPPQASHAGTSAESENSYNIDDASAVLDDSGSLGSFLDATIARSRQIENTETPNENTATPINSPESVEYSSGDPDEDYVELDNDFIDKCNATTDARKIKKFLAQHTVRYKLSPDPKFATSPINIKDKDYDFSLDLSHITIVEKTPFWGKELDEAEELLAKIGRNHDDWTTPEPTPTPILKKRGLIKLNDEDMREAKKSLKEKAIRVPQWGSCEKIRGLPQELLNLYKMICQGRSFSDDSGKISSIQLPAIRYFAYFITKCVLARKNASKLSIQDLAFLAAALQGDRTYNLGALIAYRLATNREKGGICGGLIASRLLAMHGVEPHHLDIQLSIEKLDIVSMIKHEFVSDLSNLSNLSYKITFYKKTWRTTKKIERLVGLPAPVLFNLDSRKDWSVTEGELNAYIEGDGHHARDGTEEAEEHLDSSSDAASSSHQHFGHEEPSPFSSTRGPYYDYAMYDPPAWNPTLAGVDLHLGQKPKLGGRYTGITHSLHSIVAGCLYILV
ncbi:hypothetical protein QYE76_012298 [Lolium multiflorum]|uniref:Arabidopsis retrotransposon Orf1 C-terminal domain-containing protein n=1 Tax=Lolium multiflorum TaxID=4521 RepID=A0AAD8TWY9_LOLMU|nr:hypothetical protein QYE76_012298 [Lolium multiflorum]